MQQALHILKKDLRRFWPLLAAVMIVCAAKMHARAGPGFSYGATVTLMLLWLTGIALAAHDETLTGDRQFWVTRPYSKLSLALAKLTFFVLLIHAPLLISQVVYLSLQGMLWPSLVPKLLFNQFNWLVFFTLPAWALASVARSMAAYFVVASVAPLLIIQSVFFADRKNVWMPPLLEAVSSAMRIPFVLDYLTLAIALGGTAAVLYVRHARRMQWQSSIALAAGAILTLGIHIPLHERGGIGRPVESTVQFRVDRDSPLRVAYETSPNPEFNLPLVATMNLPPDRFWFLPDFLGVSTTADARFISENYFASFIQHPGGRPGVKVSLPARNADLEMRIFPKSDIFVAQNLELGTLGLNEVKDWPGIGRCGVMQVPGRPGAHSIGLWCEAGFTESREWQASGAFERAGKVIRFFRIEDSPGHSPQMSAPRLRIVPWIHPGSLWNTAFADARNLLDAASDISRFQATFTQRKIHSRHRVEMDFNLRPSDHLPKTAATKQQAASPAAATPR